MELFARFMIVLAAVNSIYFVGLLGSCLIQRLPMTRIHVFNWGPTIARFKVRGVEVVIGTIPAGSSVNISGMMEEEAELPEGFTQRPRLGRAAVHLGSVLAILLVGLVVVGPTGGLQRVSSGLCQAVAGAWAPLSVGKACVLRYFDLLATDSLLLSIGVLCLKYAAFCLVPLPGQNLCSAVIELLTSPATRSKVSYVVMGWGVLLTFAFGMSWVVALVAALLERIDGHKASLWLVLLIASAVLVLAAKSTPSSQNKKS